MSEDYSNEQITISGNSITRGSASWQISQIERLTVTEGASLFKLVVGCSSLPFFGLALLMVSNATKHPVQFLLPLLIASALAYAIYSKRTIWSVMGRQGWQEFTIYASEDKAKVEMVANTIRGKMVGQTKTL